MKTWHWVVLTLGLPITILVMWGLGTLFGVIGQVTEPDRMIGVYEEFFDRCASIQALEDQRDSIQQEIESTSNEDRLVRLRSSLQAASAERKRAIRQYNVDADADTRAFLRDEGLPGEIDVNKEHTTCDVSGS